MFKICKPKFAASANIFSFRDKVLPFANPSMGSGKAIVSILTLYINHNIFTFYEAHIEEQILLCQKEYILPKVCKEVIETQMDTSKEYYYKHQNDWIECILIGLLSCLFYYLLYIIIEKVNIQRL